MAQSRLAPRHGCHFLLGSRITRRTTGPLRQGRVDIPPPQPRQTDREGREKDADSDFPGHRMPLFNFSDVSLPTGWHVHFTTVHFDSLTWASTCPSQVPCKVT